MSKSIPARTLNFFDKEVVGSIVEKYGMDEKKAIAEFLASETYRMLTDPEMELYRQSPLVVFDMWESEKITGDPRNSIYIRTE